jgi:TonB family protein
MPLLPGTQELERRSYMNPRMIGLVCFMGIVALTLGIAVGANGSGNIERYDEEMGMTPPVAVHKVDPEYPPGAREEKVQGVVVLDAVIDSEGFVLDVKILESPDDRLADAAMTAIQQWKFDPARDAEGNPIAVYYSLKINFALK